MGGGVCTKVPIPNCTYGDFLYRYVEEGLVNEQELDKRLQGQFVTQQLCSMLAVFDLSDEVGR